MRAYFYSTVRLCRHVAISIGLELIYYVLRVLYLIYSYSISIPVYLPFDSISIVFAFVAAAEAHTRTHQT